MGKRKKKRRRSKAKISLAITGGLIAGIAKPAELAISGQYGPALQELVSSYTGYSIANRTWNIENLKKGLVPLVIGALVHKGASWLGINRLLGRQKIPVNV